MVAWSGVSFTPKKLALASPGGRSVFYSDSSDFDGFAGFLRIPGQFLIASSFQGIQFSLPTPFGVWAPKSIILGTL